MGKGDGRLDADEGCFGGLVVWLRAVSGVLLGEGTGRGGKVGGQAEEQTALRGIASVY